jgi:hypothetical protein
VALAIGDIDNDGRIDAVVSTNGGPAHILLNKTSTTTNHWITLHLTGHKSNRDGIGAVVKLTTENGSQWVTVSTSSGYLSASDPRVHLGLGDSPQASSIEIRWPSGILQTLTHVKADRQIQVDEPTKATVSRSVPRTGRPLSSPASRASTKTRHSFTVSDCAQ